MCVCVQEMRELQEQVRDLMFYLETQKKIAQSPEGARQVSWRDTPVCIARVCVSGRHSVM